MQKNTAQGLFPLVLLACLFLQAIFTNGVSAKAEDLLGKQVVRARLESRERAASIQEMHRKIRPLLQKIRNMLPGLSRYHLCSATQGRQALPSQYLQENNKRKTFQSRYRKRV